MLSIPWWLQKLRSGEPQRFQAGRPRGCHNDVISNAAHDRFQAARRQATILWLVSQGKPLSLFDSRQAMHNLHCLSHTPDHLILCGCTSCVFDWLQQPCNDSMYSGYFWGLLCWTVVTVPCTSHGAVCLCMKCAFCQLAALGLSCCAAQHVSV